MSYCDYEDVGLLLGLTFKENSVPTAVKVTQICGWISSEINLMLNYLSIPIPAVGTDLYNLLELKSAQGAAGVIAISFQGNAESVDATQGAYYKEQYDNFIKEMKADPEMFKTLSTTLLLENPMTQGDMTEIDLDEIMIGDTIAS